jgi:ABC-2 type transport system permease protein
MTADWRVTRATARVVLLRLASNPIMLVRGPVTPILLLIAFRLAYTASGHTEVSGQSAVGFLVIGIVGTMAWDAAIWGSGHALQNEIYGGTIGPVIVAPGRTSAVIVGHGLGSIIWAIPALICCVGVGLGFGAHFQFDNPILPIICVIVLYASTLCIGLAFSGLFILTRQANAMANFLQAPIWLLAGFYVPRSALPNWLEKVSDILPIAHAMDALRAASLSAASFSDVWRPLVATVLTSLLYLAAGAWSLSRMDGAVRRRATLELS